MILVAGGTGRLGTLVSRRLAARGDDVRVLTRDPRRARHLTAEGIEMAIGDVRDPATIAAAMRGVETAVSAVHGFTGPGRVTPASVDRDGNINLIDAAFAHGAAVVLMSVVGAAPDSQMELFRAKYAAEEHLRSKSARDWTIVRSTAFIELWADILTKAPVFGRGENPINFVSVHDVAALVERAVIEPSLRGASLEIGGPENLTFNELATLVRDTTRRPKAIRHVPRLALQAMSPFARRARAASAMDTIDLTFDPREICPEARLTDPRAALRMWAHEQQATTP